MSDKQIGKTDQYGYSNYGYQEASALKVRLDTSETMEKVVQYLGAYRVKTYMDPKTGRIVHQKVKTGEPLGNAKGRAAIVNLCNLLINTQVVQGYLKRDQYISFLQRLRNSLAKEMILNKNRWGLHTNDIPQLLDAIMAFLELYISRTIDNKERDSYAKTFQTKENQVIQSKGAFFSQT